MRHVAISIALVLSVILYLGICNHQKFTVMPSSPPSIFVPAGSGGTPSAPPVVFTPAGSGGAPEAPGGIFEPAGESGSPGAPGGVFTPANNINPTAPTPIFTPPSSGDGLYRLTTAQGGNRDISITSQPVNEMRYLEFLSQGPGVPRSPFALKVGNVIQIKLSWNGTADTTTANQAVTMLGQGSFVTQFAPGSAPAAALAVGSNGSGVLQPMAATALIFSGIGAPPAIFAP